MADIYQGKGNANALGDAMMNALAAQKAGEASAKSMMMQMTMPLQLEMMRHKDNIELETGRQAKEDQRAADKLAYDQWKTEGDWMNKLLIEQMGNEAKAAEGGEGKPTTPTQYNALRDDYFQNVVAGHYDAGKHGEKLDAMTKAKDAYETINAEGILANEMQKEISQINPNIDRNSQEYKDLTDNIALDYESLAEIAKKDRKELEDGIGEEWTPRFSKMLEEGKEIPFATIARIYGVSPDTYAGSQMDSTTNAMIKDAYQLSPGLTYGGAMAEHNQLTDMGQGMQAGAKSPEMMELRKTLSEKKLRIFNPDTGETEFKTIMELGGIPGMEGVSGLDIWKAGIGYGSLSPEARQSGEYEEYSPTTLLRGVSEEVTAYNRQSQTDELQWNEVRIARENEAARKALMEDVSYSKWRQY